MHVLFGHPKLDERSKVFLSFSKHNPRLLAIAEESRVHLPNGRILLSHSRIRSQTITTPIPCSLSKDPLSSPPTLYPPNAKSS